MRANPKVMLGLSAVVVTISQLISFVITLGFAQNLTALDPDTATTEEVLGATGGVLGATLIGTAITALAQVILAGVLTVVVSRAVLGRQITLGEAWSELRPRLLSLVGMSLLVFITATIALVPCLLPGVFLYTMWWLAAPALILEKVGVTASMRRSWRLVKNSFWRTFLVLLLTVVLTAVIAGIVAVPFQFIGGLRLLHRRRRDRHDQHALAVRQHLGCHRRRNPDRTLHRRSDRTPLHRPSDAPRGSRPGARPVRGDAAAGRVPGPVTA